MIMKRNTRNTIALTAFAAAATLSAAGVMAFYKGKAPVMVENKVDSCASAGNVCRGSAPKKNDSKCDAEQGERTPGSPTFDWASCKGFCGDGIKQDGETADNCPLDVHCGDGKVEAYAKRVFMKCADDACSRLETYDKVVKESCNKRSGDYCAEDCGDAVAPKETPDAGAPAIEPVDAGRPEPVDAAPPPPAVKSGGACEFRPGESFCPRAQNDLKSRIDSSMGAVASAASCAGKLTVGASIRVGSDGTMGRPSAFVTCDGKPVPGAASAVNLSGIAAGRQCTYPPKNAPCSIGASASR